MLKNYFTLLAIIIPFILNAQSGTNDYLFNTLDDGTYNSNADFNNSVRAMGRLSSGKYVVAGDFTQYDASITNRIALLDSNGLIDNSFQSGTGFDGTVRSIVIDTNDNIFVGGDFTSYNGFSANRIIKLKSNGDIDSSFTTGLGFNNDVYTIKIDANGKLLVGGNFFNYDTVYTNKIVRLNPNGIIDTTFNSGGGFSSRVRTISIQNDGKIVVGGDFSNYDGTVRRKIARLNPNGTIDLSFDHGPGINGGFNGRVNATAIYNNKIVVGGAFTKYDNISVNQLVVLNLDGSRDTTFLPVLFMNSVNTIQVLSNNKIIFGGDPYVNGPVPFPNIIQVDSSGSEDLNFINGDGFDDNVYVIVKDANSKLMVGGEFLKYHNGNEKKYVTRLKSNGYPDGGFKTVHGFDKPVHAAEVQQNNSILVGGEFTTFNGELVNQLVLLKPNGEFDSNFVYAEGPTFGSTSSFSPYIYQILSQDDGKITLCGTFDYYNKVSRNSMVRLKPNGVVDSTFSMNLNTSTSSIIDFAMQPDGKYIIGGTFTNAFFGLNKYNRIARVDSTGWQDNTFATGTGFNNTVYAIELQPDGKVLVGGLFTSYDGVSKNAIARLNSDGSLDTSFSFVLGAGSFVRTIELLPDSSIMLGGKFAVNINGFKRNLVKLKSDGSIDSTFNYSMIPTLFAQDVNSTIHKVTLHQSGNLIITGDLEDSTAIRKSGIVSLTTDGQIDTLYHSSKVNTLSEYIYGLELQPDGKVLYFGDHKSYDNVVRNKIGRLHYYPAVDSIIGNYVICDSTGNTTLTAYSSFSNPVFNWYDSITGGTLLHTGATYTTPTLTSSKTYYVSVSSGAQVSLVRDSITVILNSPAVYYLSDTICQGDSVLIGGFYQNSSGTYYDSLQTVYGCDSIIELNLTVDTSLTANFSQSIDPSDSLNLLVNNLSSGNNLKYLWDFGDGNFSTDSFPTHVYSAIGVYNICLTVTDSVTNCISVFCDSTTNLKVAGIKTINSLSTSLSMEYNVEGNVDIYPNPTNSILNITNNQAIKQGFITDLTGKVLKSIKTKTNQIDVSDLADGVYLLQIHSNNQIITKKFIKN